MLMRILYNDSHLFHIWYMDEYKVNIIRNHPYKNPNHIYMYH